MLGPDALSRCSVRETPTMTSKDRSKLIRQIKSKKVGERVAATRSMWKSGDSTFGAVILEALKNETLHDPSVWKSKCLMIAALGDLRYRPALRFLKALVSRDFQSATIIYAELAMAICQLIPIRSGKMDFVWTTMKSPKPLLVCGAYHAIYYLKLDLQEDEIIPLIRFAREYSRRHPDDEQLSCMPRDYLAAAASRWKGKAVRDFLISCRASKFPHLQEIASSSLKGDPSDDSRLGWYK